MSPGMTTAIGTGAVSQNVRAPSPPSAAAHRRGSSCADLFLPLMQVLRKYGSRTQRPMDLGVVSKVYPLMVIHTTTAPLPPPTEVYIASAISTSCIAWYVHLRLYSLPRERRGRMLTCLVGLIAECPKDKSLRPSSQHHHRASRCTDHCATG